MAIRVFLTSALFCCVFCSANAQGTINGPKSLCEIYTATYTVSGSSATTGYIWAVTSGTINSGQGSNTVVISFQGSGLGRVVSVTGNGLSASMVVNVYSRSTPIPISGPTLVCPGGSATYTSLIPVPWHTSSSWVSTGLTGGSVIAQSSTSYTVVFPENFSSGQIAFYGVFGVCGAGLPALLNVTASTNGTLPAPAGEISGNDKITTPVNGVAFTTPAIQGATAYQWDLPAGASIASGANTRSIIVNFSAGFTGGYISVAGTNGVCRGIGSSLVLSHCTNSTMPGTITGNAVVCQGQKGVVYSIPSQPHAVSYEWTLPFETVATTQPSIEVDFPVNAASGVISVRTIDAVGCESPLSSKSIIVNVMPVITSQPLNRTLVLGASASFSVATQTGSFTYQWTKNNSNISGATSSTYTISNANQSHSGNYNVIVKSGNGCEVRSHTARLYSQIGSQGDQNYVVTRKVGVPNVTNESSVATLSSTAMQVSVSYFDGLGRLIQQVNKSASPSQNDIVIPTLYDKHGREARKYLPFVLGDGSGLLKDISYTLGGDYTHGFYDNTARVAKDNKPFSETFFEPSPMNRPHKVFGPGEDWSESSNNRFTEHKYSNNVHQLSTSEVGEKIIHWIIGSNGIPVRAAPATGRVESGGFYSDRQLSVITKIDEQGNSVREFTNKDGRIVLRKIQVSSTSASNLNNTAGWALTYYVFDDFGNLRFVLQPELAKMAHDNNGFSLSSNDLANFAFQYRYDGRGRMTMKKVPGAGEVYMVYDFRDRIVLTQDANQRMNEAGITNRKDWSFTKYDAHNRPVLTGTYTAETVLTQMDMQDRVNQFYAGETVPRYETFVGNVSGNVHGYSNTSFPNASDPNRYLTITYYDSYDFRALWKENFDFESDGLQQVINGHTYSFPSTYNKMIEGQVTGTKVKELDGSPLEASTWLRAITYYDEKYLAIQTKSENYKGGINRTSTLHDFEGSPLHTRTTYQEYHISWKETINTNSFGAKIEKAGGTGWNAAMFSNESLPADSDGWVEWTAEDTRPKVIGLNAVNQSNYLSMDYGIYLQNAKATVREQNVDIMTITTAYKAGDIFRIERIGTNVRYFYNGTLAYTRAITSRPALYLDVTMNDSSTFVTDFRSSFAQSTWRIDRRFEYDHAKRLINTYHKIGEGERAQWTNLTGVIVSSGTLTKTNEQNWNAGASSIQFIPAGKNGWMEFTGSQLNHGRMIGLADDNLAGAGYTTIDYCFYLHGDNVNIRENGTDKGIALKYEVDDVFRIERQGSVVYYKKNGSVIYTSGISSTTQLHIDCSLYHVGSKLENAFIGTEIGASEVMIARNEYNEIGQLVDKSHHIVGSTTEKQSIDYRYNIRGWLTSINNAALINDGNLNNDSRDLFGMQLSYNLPDADLQNTTQHNGNISGIKWSNYPGTGESKQKGYIYTYDAMDRLLSSTFKELRGIWSSRPNSIFAESGFQYDLNGNIERLVRNDGRGSGLMDNLVFNYGTSSVKSNRLLAVADNGDDLVGFVDGADGSAEYYYDANGNMIRDLNKKIGNDGADQVNRITYNHLNLPQTVSKAGNTVRYIYDATGNKLAQFVYSGGASKRSDYMGELIFENDALQFVNHEEGRTVIVRNELVYLNDGSDTSNGTAVRCTVTPFPFIDDQFVKVTYNNATPNLKSGWRAIGGPVVVKKGERYHIRVKGFRATNPVHLWVKLNNQDLVWKGIALPEGFLASAVVEQSIVIPEDGVMDASLVWDTAMENGESFYVSEFQVTRSAPQSPEYQYHLKDHLGNVRLTYTTKTTTNTFTAGFEDAAQATEANNFSNYPSGGQINTQSTNARTGTNSQLLNGGYSGQIGVAKSFSVMPGDVVSIQAYAKYASPSGSTTNFGNFVASMLSAFSLQAPAVGETGTAATGIRDFGLWRLAYPGNDATKVFVMIVLFDRDHNFLDVAFQASSSSGASMSRTYTVKEPGYAYLYISNEHPSLLDAYFDDVAMTHTQSPVIAMDDYYPFGLTFNSYSRENTTPQDFKFNGKEEQNELGLGWLDYGARMYQPDLGRWTAIDPMSHKYRRWSPYNYAVDNPLRFIDPDGRDIINLSDRVTFTGNDAQILFRALQNNSQKKQGNRLHLVFEERTPQIYRHTLNAFRAGKPQLLHYDAEKKRHKVRRDEATLGYPTVKGKHRDEYPYASTYEGGKGALVEYVDAKENLTQGGDLSRVYDGMKDGDPFLVIPVPKDKEPEKEPAPVPEDKPVPVIPVVPVPTTSPTPAPVPVPRAPMFWFPICIPCIDLPGSSTPTNTQG